MSYNFTKFDTPLLEHIPGGLHYGKMFIIKGFTQYGFQRVSINLQSDSSDDAVIAFHLNPRMDNNEVCCNSYDGGWGDEQINSEYFPFNEGQRFTLRIVVEEEAYRVFVNGSFFMEFCHRVDIESVKWLRISDGIELHEVIMRDFVKVPYVGTIENGMAFGKAIQIKGVPTFDDESNPNMVRFSINFCYEGHNDEFIGLHFNPRPDGETVVLNNYDGGWGDEQVIEYNPFRPWTMFDLMFVATEEGMKIFLDNKLFAQYPFRCAVHDLRYLHIKGSVSIASVEYLEPLPNDYVKEIASGLQPKDVIKVKGLFRPEGERFFINLKSGEEIPLHFNPRRAEGEVVMNNYSSSDEWGEELREPLPESFTDFVPFEIKIKVRKDKFKIYINERSYAKFYVRQEIDHVYGINIGGDADFYQVKLLRRMEPPYIEELPSAMDYGRWLHITGAVIKHQERFHIELKSGDNVALHFNPRVTDEVVVRNSFLDGEWGEEDRENTSFPFEESEPFEIFISSQPDAYKIYVNGVFFVDYPHRMPCQSVSHLLVADGAHFFEPEIL